MDSCESPVFSGTDDGLSSPQQQQPPQPWNDHPSLQVPCTNQAPSLDPLSFTAPYTSQPSNPSALHDELRELQSHHQLPKQTTQAQRESPATGQLHSKREGLEEEEQDGESCGEEEESEDLDEMEIDSCFPSLQSFPGVAMAPGGGSMPTLLRHQPTQQQGIGESGSEEGEEEEEEESSDVENLAGEIVYQPDGSAYIVESLSQLIQSGGSMVPGLLPTNSLNSGGKPGEPAGTPSSVYPQIINTFHIASSFGKWFGNSDQFSNTSTMAGFSPVLHSFRVFDVRHTSNKDYLNSDGSAKKSCVSKDVPNNVDLSKFDGLALYGKGKPILMCFLCKLSFGYARSFATHAIHDHRMTLCEDERRLLGDKHASAIIQGIGKDKEPLISFLEPNIKSTPVPPLLPMNSGQSFYGTFSGVHLESGSSSGGSETLLNKDCDSGLQQQQQQQTQQSSVLPLGRLGNPKASTISSTPGSAKDSSALSKHGGRTEEPTGKELACKGKDGATENHGGTTHLSSQMKGSEQEETLFGEEDEVDAEGTVVTSGVNSSSGGGEAGEAAVSNQSISKSPLLMPSSTLQPTACTPAVSYTLNSKSPASTSCSVKEEISVTDSGGRFSEPVLSFNCQGPTVPMAMAAANVRKSEDDTAGTSSSPLSSNAAADESANRDSATAPEPNDCPAEEEEENGSLLQQHHMHHHHHHLHTSSHGHTVSQPGGSCDITGVNDCSQNHSHSGGVGSGVECPKCDTILGSSRSLGGHMTMMHSRNSCKTLKCPKCNWHYKYQQTLEAHMKEKHPDSGGSCAYCSSGQSHPRLARGESYTCGYKPFRCEVCNYSTTTKGNLSIHMQSDKHLNNMQTLQNGGSIGSAQEQVFGHGPGGVVAVPSVTQASSHHPAHHHSTQSSVHITGPCGAPSPTKPKSKPTWRCEVCDYETNVARNLRIHMTSEKHMHNMMLLQQNVTQMQHGRIALGAMPSPSEAELYQYYLTQNMSLPPGLKMDPTGPEAQFLMGGFSLDPSMAALAPALVGGEIPMDMRLGSGQLVSEELMTLGESLSQTSDPSLKLFQCAVCNGFTTDNLDVLGLHMGAERSLPEEEWRAVVGDSHQCKLCHYTTQLKANFQLHCKTDKHIQKYQLVAHIKEGGKGNEWRLKCVAIGNPVHLKCNACDYYTNSLEKLRMHTVNSRHEASLKLYKHLQQHENAVEGDACYYHCVLCNYSTKAKLNLIQHVRSMKHQRSESLRKLQRLQKGLPEDDEDLSSIFTIRKCPSSDTGELSEDVEAASETTTDQEDQTKDRESGGEKELTKGTAVSVHSEQRHTDSPIQSKRPSSRSDTSESALSSKRPRTAEKRAAEQMYQCPYCKFTNTDLNRLRMHVMTQHSVQPMLRCPLCQDMLNNKVHLQFHLTHLHSVAPDCVDKLIATVTATDVLPASMFIPVPGPLKETQNPSHAVANSEDTKKQADSSDVDLEKGVSLPTEIAEARKSPLEDQQTEKDDATGFLCWKKGCNQVFKSSNSLQMHFNEVHNKRPQLPVSDRHVYKYRCNQCSLAFKTVEKLQLHSQYHVIRAATMCCLCQRSFRTLQALKKHLETSHLELSEADIQQLYGGLLMNGDIMVMSDVALGDEHGGLGEDDKEGDESDPEEKQSPTGSDSGSLLEDSGSEPKRALPFRKGPNFTMEKFLDPSRPFKCTVCKESFTQKNILLVHYNSVSHLHKVKRALQESTTGQPEPTSSPDNKPFKCSTCNVAYSQSSTLEIHMRSVLHQTKARAAKLEAAGGIPSSASITATSGGSTIISTSTSPSPASNSTNSTNYSSSGSQTAQSLIGGTHTSQGHSHDTSSLVISRSSPSENHEAKKAKYTDMLSVRGQQQLQQQQQLAQAQAQAQAQLQQELQQQAALLQSQLFNPALLQHFPMTTDALISLQQQQLLFPFYIPGGEFQLNPEINISNSALGLTGSTTSLLEDLKNSAQQSCLQQQLMHHHLQQQQQQQQPHAQAQGQMALLQQSASLHQQVEKKQKPSSSQIDKEKDLQREKNITEKNDDANKDSMDKLKERKELQHISASISHDTGLLPPRIASDARGNATKALLENFGFELVIQYNENKQKSQKKGTGPAGSSEPGGITRVVDPIERLEKLECEACGKLFSNVLILKSHQEHIHQAFFPFRSLERFAKEYRENYDKLYPLRPPTPEAAPAPPPPPPPPPPQRAPTPNIPVSAASLTPPTVPTPQPQITMPQITMSMDLPIFSPLMMQPMSLQSLPSQMPPQLQSVETSLASDLAQLYQQQLTPAMLQQQQNKRPRTRITDDQLRVLRQYFDINNSPNEEQIKEMADKSGLQQKVIKHWFRNTLFKERQRNKDSPYNFNNPPTTTLEDTKIDSKPPSPEPQKHDFYGSKRSSRTRFTDYQLRILQDFFDANAYPKDDEFEQLSNLLGLPTRVIVVWFQNARQKARKNYENQSDGVKEGERRELSNDRYIRTSNLNYQCKKCSLVFQRIFDLIKHQKKLCYKDEDEDGQYESHNEDSMDLSNECYTPSGSSCHTPMPSSSSLCPLPPSTSAFAHLSSADKDEASPATTSNLNEEKSKELSGVSADPQENKTAIKQENVPQTQSESQQLRHQREEKMQCLTKPNKHSSSSFNQQQQSGPSVSQTSQAPSQSSHMSHNPHLSSATQQMAQQMIQYQCDQCKIGFPSFEHWQEHQQLHFLSVQNQFIHPQFLDRPMDMPFMLFDPSNPLLASQLLSGAMPQIPTSSATSPSTPTSTMNSLKRKLEEKAGTSPGENDSTNSEEPQRDKRLRTTITPEQLEILYQKYLLDSNPTRKMLDHIAHEVGLKKRVVQVWFQNTRARERKGQFRAVGPAQAHRRCPFCRALFKAKTALEAHIRSRHWHEAKRAGYNLALTSMLPDQEGMQIKLDALEAASYSQMVSSNMDGQSSSMSPVNRGMDLSPRALLSPSSIKVEGMEDFENTGMSSVNLSFDPNKLDNDDCSSVNTAITDTTTGDEANADNDSADAKHSQSSSDYLSKPGGTAPILENDDQMSSGLVSPATSYYAKDYENEHIIDHSETSSMADPCSPSPGASGTRSIDSGDRPGQKRFRTQMTNLQLKLLKSCFNDYRTPTMLECEVLGNDIGLPKRVVQVWFQNARAKEKKAKLNMAKHFGINQTSYEGPKTECTLCGVKYSARLSVRDHIFSQQHISKVKDTIGSQIDKEKEYFDPATVRQLMAQQEMDRIKKANEVLGLAQQQAMQQQGMFDNPAMQALNLQSAYSNLQGIPPVLLPGVGSPSLSSFNSSNSALTPPKPSNLLNMPGAGVPSPSLPTSGLPNKPPSSSSLSTSSPAQTSTSVSHSSPTSISNSTSSTSHSISRPEHTKDREGERLRDKEKPKEKAEKPSTPSSTGGTPAPSTSAASAKKEKPDPAVPATSMPTPGMEYVVDPAQLQALQAALASDPTALLTNQFLPYFMPGFSPYYTPQIPGALQGGYLQPMYGMESLFPYNPALSQALMGLSPGSLLQHYQQYQQSLQEALQQQQQQLQQIQQPKASQNQAPSKSLGNRKESAKDPVKTEEQKGNPHSASPTTLSTSSTPNKIHTALNEVDGKAADPHLDKFIVPKAQYKLACRKCQAVFPKEEAAITHLKSNCFFGQSVANLQEMLLRVPSGVGAGAGSLYDCLACDTTLDGEKALSQHLESALHKHRTIKRSSRNAKEHATSLLPHSSACFPNPNTTSTSQSATHPISSPTPPPTTSATMPSSVVSATLCSSSSSSTQLNATAAGKPWPQAPFSRALVGKPNASLSTASSLFPPVSSPSTVTSSSLSTSGVQTSIPTDVFTDESDSDSSQKSADRLGRTADEPQQPGFVKDSSSCSSNLTSVETDSIRL
ncbi:zinc finger homeobox protein 3 isoform X1 [Entelurus aequoreus]|uniref:zinc finger homeobox protein 3 isoform X1 n=1 Tax=Entelurus aequoreus TaxID=161455 RepID=UPI002B1DD6EA|nr:zinc finger homeobox protein 3 isoform X1 [Entelurus aequoreus]XP_061884085.1 zinc finger homeobox protein 3 isoform X1 [Entelurus aequoreus]XP_061884094.1 zinc finger homeobox protein 3 isoform X1 [Entelurus aequoreus]